MIYIYSDATTTNGHAVCTSFIITDTTYLGVVTQNYDNVFGSIHGELLAIKQGLDYICNLDLNDEDVVIYTDNREALQHIQSATKSKHFQRLLASINDFKDKYNIQFCYIEGHSSEHNPNKTVDILARRVNKLLYK